MCVVCVWNQGGIGDGSMGELRELHQRGVGEGVYVGMEGSGAAASITNLRLMESCWGWGATLITRLELMEGFGGWVGGRGFHGSISIMHQYQGGG